MENFISKCLLACYSSIADNYCFKLSPKFNKLIILNIEFRRKIKAIVVRRVWKNALTQCSKTYLTQIKLAQSKS